MRGSKSKNTKPEWRVRRLAHRLGYRYRLHLKALPGCPDLVFVSRRKVIFVHGCVWHQHQDSHCPIVQTPRSNTDYWLPKLRRNVERDLEQQRKLTELRWEVLVLWECEIKDEKKLRSRLWDFLGPPGPQAPSPAGSFSTSSPRPAPRR